MAYKTRSQKHLESEEEAFRYVESIIWEDGKKCPKCDNKEKIYQLKGRSVRVGLHKCSKCRKQFTVCVGTIFEDRKIPLHKWLQAFHLICSSNDGASPIQIQKALGITYKSAWLLTQKITELAKSCGIEIVSYRDDNFVSNDEGDDKQIATKDEEGGNQKKSQKHSFSTERMMLTLIKNSNKTNLIKEELTKILSDAYVRNR